MEIAKIILSHFFKFGKPQTRYRDVKTGRFASGRQVRVTVGTGISVHSKRIRITQSKIVNAEMVRDAKEELTEMVYSQIEGIVGYDREEWNAAEKIEIGTEVLEIEESDTE